MFIFPLDQLPYYQNYAFREHFLSPEECDRVLAVQSRQSLQEAIIRKDDIVAGGKELRRSRAAVVPWIKEVEWLCQRLAAAVLECNKSLYHFHLAGFMENLQFDQYQAGAFYDWHQDFAFRELSIRKISVVVQLSDPGQYEGGDLEFFSGQAPQKAGRGRGTLLIFPSFVVHRISPVVSGIRNALAGWVAGPPFQ